MGRKKIKPLLENVTIEAVAAEGKSLAHIDGKVVFVPLAIPGDVVDIQVNKVRRGYMEGFVTKLVKPSADRLAPFCSHYEDCGGCAWQILPYPLQIAFKQQQVVDQLTRIGHLQLPEISPIIGSEKIEEYRNKLEYTFSRRRWVLSDEEPQSLSDEERLGLGFHVKGFFDKVLDIKRCHLQPSPSNEIRLFIREYAISKGLTFFDLREQTGFMRTLIVRTASTGEVMLTIAFGPDAVPASRFADIEALMNAVAERFPEITSLNYVINPKGNDTINDLEITTFRGRGWIYEQMEDLKFKIGPKSFYQTNSEQAYKLYSVVRNFARQAVSDSTNCCKPIIYDLYTGTGTIALFLSSMASKVVGIEYVPEAIEDAKENASVNGIDNAVFYAGDMKDVLNETFIEDNGKPDIVVLDPPRAGIHPDVAEVLLKTAAPKMIYVSCNPASQARDLAIFARDYEITAVQPVDMFPHTHHVENVVFLNHR
ncbi:MAG: 23S rRNA (uracil(1939)-C(5))-methyltransferase RlmD [Bacteroidales bacterium]|nr:23S rRNA (uracil(1939)-C(5))-methyltransferase RlmD [Bacteroidales bacterium]